MNIHIQVFGNILSFLLGKCLEFTKAFRSGMAGSYGRCIFNIFRNCQTLSLMAVLYISPAVSESSSCSISSPTVGAASLYSFSHSNRYRVVSLWF